MDCPKCVGKLEEIKVGKNNSIAINRCFACGGLWFDKEEISRVVNKQILDTIETEIISQPLEDDELWDEINLNQREATCPHCKVTMKKEKSPRKSKVLIDICPQCEGVWLDAGEWDVISTRDKLEQAFETVIDFFRLNFVHIFR